MPADRSIWSGAGDGRFFASAVHTPAAFARKVEPLHRKGFLRAVSVGFRE